MNKKKILTLCLVACLAITAIAGASLAYFTDTDSKTNTFTVGNVDITLDEKFDEENAVFMPVVGSAQDGSVKNQIEKVVQVTNNSNSSDAYVRVRIAFPLDTMYYVNGEINESKNLIHFNQKGSSMADGKWSWWDSYDKLQNSNKTYPQFPGYPNNGPDQNVYTTTINGKDYLVFVGTYMTKLAGGESTGSVDDITTAAIYQVYLAKEANTTVVDGKTMYTNGILTADMSDVKIYVVAEGCQAAGFDNAYDALNTAFGVPGDKGDTIVWPAD